MADRQLEKIGKFNRNIDLAEEYPESHEGPMWLGKLNSDIVKNLNTIENPDRLFLKSLNEIKNNDLSLYFADVADFARIIHHDSTGIEPSMQRLTENGIICGRTQFSNTGIKVSVPVNEALHLIY